METTCGTSPSPVADDLWAVMTAEPAGLVAVATERLEAELCTLAAHIDAALCRWLCLLAEYDRREAFTAWECGSCAQWLSWKCGVSVGTAREHVRVAHALETLPLIRAAFAAGELSYSKVRALTRVAQPGIEAALIDVAKAATAAGLERICRAYGRHGRHANNAKPDEPDNTDDATGGYRQRCFVWFHDEDGSLVFHGRVPPEDAPTVLAMLAAARHALNQPDPIDHRNVPARTPRSTHPSDTGTGGDRDVPAGTPTSTQTADAGTGGDRNVPAGTPSTSSPPDRDTLGARNADAFVLAAESFLAHRTQRRHPPDVRELTVIIDETRLTNPDTPNTDGDSFIDNGPTISSHLARRLGCDCTAVAAVIATTGDPLHVGRATRIINRRLRRALRLRDNHCRFPGCDRQGRLDAHHITHWANGGPTNLDNLVLLCAKHHRDVHEGGYTLHAQPTQPDRGAPGALGPRGIGEITITVRRPDGTPLTTQPTPINPTHTLPTIHHDLGLTINHHTNQCYWEGRTANITDIITYFDTTLEHQHRPHATN